MRRALTAAPLHTERRCQHGFLRSVASCSECDRAEAIRLVPRSGSYFAVREARPRCSRCGRFYHDASACPVQQEHSPRQKRRAIRNAGPKLKFRPIPAEHAEPAPRRTDRQ